MPDIDTNEFEKLLAAIARDMIAQMDQAIGKAIMNGGAKHPRSLRRIRKTERNRSKLIEHLDTLTKAKTQVLAHKSS